MHVRTDPWAQTRGSWPVALKFEEAFEWQLGLGCVIDLTFKLCTHFKRGFFGLLYVLLA